MRTRLSIEQPAWKEDILGGIVGYAFLKKNADFICFETEASYAERIALSSSHANKDIVLCHANKHGHSHFGQT